MTIERAISLVQEFEKHQKKHPGPIPHSIHFDFKKIPYHIHFSAVFHGDEVGSLPGLLSVIEDLQTGKISYSGKVTFTLGNVEALKKGVRFVEEDLNRVFYDFNSSPSLERKRAKELAHVIDQADIFCDFHQTICPTSEAFYLFKNKPRNHHIIRSLGVTPFVITSEPQASINPGKVAGVEYAEKQNTPGFVIELTQKGFNPDAAKKARELMLNMFRLAEKIPQDPQAAQKQSQEFPQLKHLQISHHQTFSDRKMRLHPGWKNLQYINKGTILGTHADESDLVMPHDGYFLFPKYPHRDQDHTVIGPVPVDLFMVAQ